MQLDCFASYQKILVQANAKEHNSFTVVDELKLPTSHAMIGCLLAQSWWLSEETCLAIRHHHHATIIQAPAVTPALTSRYRITLSLLAELLVQRHSELRQTQKWPKPGATCLRLLNIAEHEVDGILAESIHIMKMEG